MLITVLIGVHTACMFDVSNSKFISKSSMCVVMLITIRVGLLTACNWSC